MSFWEIVISSAVFILIVSADLFACGFVYGINNVHIPFKKVLLINIISSFMISGGLFIGYYLGAIISAVVANWICFFILMLLGIIKISEWLINLKKEVQVRRNILWKETFVLSIALSLDGLAVGVSASITQLSLVFIITVISISLVTNQLIFGGGQWLGERLTKKTRLKLGWLSGFALVGMAVVKLFI